MQQHPERVLVGPSGLAYLREPRIGLVEAYIGVAEGVFIESLAVYVFDIAGESSLGVWLQGYLQEAVVELA